MKLATLLVATAAVTAQVAWAQDPGNPIDARVRSSSAAAQSYQGPLDGGWTLVASDGRAILAFQLVDKPGGRAPLEGVWRDLRRPVVPGDIGFVDALVRSPGGLDITLNAAPGAAAVTITLHTDPAGGWAGVMRENSADQPVKMRRG